MTGGFTQYSLQKAVYTKLTNAKAITDLTSQIYSTNQPDGAEPPYIVIFSESRGDDWSTKSFSGEQINFEIDVISRKKSNEECMLIIDAVINALHREQDNMPLGDGNKLVLIEKSATDIIIASDGRTHVGNILMRALTTN